VPSDVSAVHATEYAKPGGKKVTLGDVHYIRITAIKFNSETLAKTGHKIANVATASKCNSNRISSH
jgi:predicted PilT family ATPase